MNGDAYRQWFESGLTEGDAIAAVLDPKRAIPALEQKVKDARFTQLSNAAAKWAEELADLDVTVEQVRQGYQQIGRTQATMDKLGGIYGDPYSVKDAEDDLFLGSAEAANRRKSLVDKEKATFSGRTLADSRSLGGGSY
jgi:hypothetical protein